MHSSGTAPMHGFIGVQNSAQNELHHFRSHTCPLTCAAIWQFVSVLVVPYHECMHTQFTRLCLSRLEVDSATTVSLCICGVIRLMCCAAGEWELRLSPWRLRPAAMVVQVAPAALLLVVCLSDLLAPLWGTVYVWPPVMHRSCSARLPSVSYGLHGND